MRFDVSKTEVVFTGGINYDYHLSRTGAKYWKCRITELTSGINGRVSEDLSIIGKNPCLLACNTCNPF